jgi:type I restriction enzyme R subunit
MSTIPRSNFAHLHEYDEQLMHLGVLAEKYFTNDPVAYLLNLQEFSTLLAQLLAARVGLLAAIDESYYDL